MLLRYTKIFIFTGLLVFFLTSCASDTYAAVGTVSGKVITKPTDTGVANIWIKWTSPIDQDNPGGRYVNMDGWPYEGNIGIRYAKTDNSGTFIFPHQTAPMYDSRLPGWDNGHSPLNINARIQSYLTWINPEQPEIKPDIRAWEAYKRIVAPHNLYKADNQYDIQQINDAQLNIIFNAIKQVQQLKPEGNGWVRLNNRTHLNGGFQCDAPPTFTAIKPKNFKGFFNNNDQKMYDWGNGYVPVVLQQPFELNVTGPTGFLDGDGVFAGSGNENSCSIYGWAKDLSSDLKYDVEVYIGGNAESSAASIKTKADKQRGDALNGFGFDIRLPDQYKDGVKKNIHAYAIDTDGTKVPLAQTPRSMICGTAENNPPQEPQRVSVDLWAVSGGIPYGQGNDGVSGTFQVKYGDPTTLNWTSQNVDFCSASGDWTNTIVPNKPSQSTLTDLRASATYKYTLTCFNISTGAEGSDTVILSVRPQTVPPTIQTTGGDVHSNESITLPQR